VLVAALIIAMQAAASSVAHSQPSGGGDPFQKAGFDDYRKHLENLDALVAACRKQRNSKVCDPDKVGPDDRLQWTSSGTTEQREIRYDWLRLLLGRAGENEKAAPPSPGQVKVLKAQPVSADELLNRARTRLAEDLEQAQAPPNGMAGHAAERRSLQAILARPEYRGVQDTSAQGRLSEWFDNLVNRILSSLVSFSSRSPWIAFVLWGLLVGAILLGLVYILVRIEWRSRIGPATAFTPSDSPSAREWQLWLHDAHNMASQGLWREAIRFLYWAAISRLESKRLWPADRARTPREYLRLLSEADQRLASLTILTSSFERTWYGGRQAGSDDFQAALRQAAELGVE
jgi:hypothetical protein